MTLWAWFCLFVLLCFVVESLFGLLFGVFFYFNFCSGGAKAAVSKLSDLTDDWVGLA